MIKIKLKKKLFTIKIFKADNLLELINFNILFVESMYQQHI
jgi:hypothetical protein